MSHMKGKEHVGMHPLLPSVNLPTLTKNFSPSLALRPSRISTERHRNCIATLGIRRVRTRREIGLAGDNDGWQKLLEKIRLEGCRLC
jgi:hypothetical protein